MTDRMLEVIVNRLVEHEGKRKYPYTDTAGKLSIGVGRNLTDKGLRDNEMQLMLLNDIREALQDANRYVWFERLDPGRRLVIVELMFNLGYPRFSGFKRMILALNAGNYEKAADEMLDSKWAKQVGQRAETLAKLMREGDPTFEEE